MIEKNIGIPKLYQTMDLIPKGWSWNSTRTENTQSTRTL